jgi:cell division protein FtsQ
MRSLNTSPDRAAARSLLMRRKLHRWLPRRPARFALILLGLGALGACWAGAADFIDNGSRLRTAVFGSTAAIGLSVQDIQVTGRSVTAREDILKALGAGRGTPILAVNPETARAQLETLPWVRTASVERRLPDTLFVTLTERQPLALWQRHGKMVLIDHDGVVVATEHLERYGDLLLVVGEDAPAHTEALIALLATQPEMQKHVSSAVRVAERRWNLILDSGVTVELPEDGAEAAWAHFAVLERDHAILARDIEKVDLRLPDRVSLKVAPEPPKPEAKPPKPGAKNT